MMPRAEYGDPFEDLSEEERRRFLEQAAGAGVPMGPTTRAGAGAMPAPTRMPSALMPDREALKAAPQVASVPDDDLMRRFAEAQQRGAGNASFNRLGARLDNFARIYAGVPERDSDESASLRQRPVADLMQQEGVKSQQRNAARQTELDAVNLAKTRAETSRAEAQAKSTTEEAAREAAMDVLDSPESNSVRATAAELLKGRVSPETLATQTGRQIRDTALKFGVSLTNAEAMGDYRNNALRVQDENADASRRLQAEALAQGWDIATMNAEAREAAAAKDGANRTTDQESKLRTELQNLPPVKEYQLAAIGLDKVRAAAKDPSAAGDLALIFGLMKTLDPTSTVREGEFANAQNATGIPERLQNIWNKALTGQRLAPEQRREFIASAEGQFSAYKSRADALIGGYRKLAQDSGLNPDRIILDGTLIPAPSRAPMPGGDLAAPLGQKSSLAASAPPAASVTPPSTPSGGSRVLKMPANLPAVETDPLRQNKVHGSGTEDDPYILSIRGKPNGYMRSFLADGDVVIARDLDGGRILQKVGEKMIYRDGKPPPLVPKAGGK